MTAVRVPATSANLGAGFDAFGVALSLHLTAQLVPRGELRVSTTGEGEGEVATGDDNLVWRSLVLACERFGAAVPDASIAVDSAVPLERGLGSSSAAIVAGVALARSVSPTRVADADLVRLAAEIEGHPDNVAAAVLGGVVVVAVDDAGELVLRRAQPHPRLRPVAFIARGRQATSAARAVLPDSLSREDAATDVARGAHVLAALVGVWPADPRLSGDRLHEPPRLAAAPDTAALLASLRDRGVHAWLSGAGPSVLAAVPTRDATPDDAATSGVDVRPLTWDRAGVVIIRP